MFLEFTSWWIFFKTSIYHNFILIVQVNDTVVLNITSGKITDFVKFDAGNLCMITSGRNIGRVGIVGHRERHPGSFDIVHIKDASGNTFTTR